MAPDERNVSLDDLEEPSYYTSEGLYTFARSESLVVVHFVEGISEEMAATELAERGFGFSFKLELGNSPELTIASTIGMARHFPLLRRSRVVEWATPVLLSSDGRPNYPFNQISMAFIDGVSRGEREARIQSVGGRILRNDRKTHYLFEIAWSRADSVFTIARQLHEDPDVLYATPNWYLTWSPWW